MGCGRRDRCVLRSFLTREVRVLEYGTGSRDGVRRRSLELCIFREWFLHRGLSPQCSQLLRWLHPYGRIAGRPERARGNIRQQPVHFDCEVIRLGPVLLQSLWRSGVFGGRTGSQVRDSQGKQWRDPCREGKGAARWGQQALCLGSHRREDGNHAHGTRRQVFPKRQALLHSCPSRCAGKGFHADIQEAARRRGAGI